MENSDLISTKTSRLSIFLLLVSALAAIFLAGGPRQGGMGIFLMIAGMVLVIFPAPRAASWVYWLLALLIVAAASSSLFPVEWLGRNAIPPWRMELALSPAISLPIQITLDPVLTHFWIMVLGLSLLIAIYLLASPLPGRAMEEVALIMTLGCSAYAIVAWIDWKTEWHYPFFIKEEWMQSAYGFFPNRNHTAGFLLTGVILSLGLIHRGMTSGRMFLTLVASASIALLVSMLLFFSISRGGIVFLLLGMFIWVAGLGSFRSRWLIAAIAIVAVVTLFFFLNSESGLLTRLKVASSAASIAATPAQLFTQTDSDTPPSLSLRGAIWRDTLSMISAYPLTGTGLGTYAITYPFYAKKSFSPSVTAHHAESDFLTLCSEVGIPSLLLVIAVVILLASRIPQLFLESGQEWPVRWALLSAFFAELLHGLVDVPLHKPELGWWLMLLGGIGFSTAFGKVEAHLVSRGIQRIFFLLGGVCLLILGGMMMLAQWGGGKSLPPFSQTQAEGEIVKVFGNGNASSIKEAVKVARLAITEHPMADPLYYQLGLMLLESENDTKKAASVFEAEQLISPNDPAFVFAQGKAFASHDPVAAADFWNEALKRQLQLGTQNRQHELRKACDLYRTMISEAAPVPALFERLAALASDTPEFRVIWLQNPACSQTTTREWVNDSAFFQRLQPLDQSRILEHWWKTGDHASVTSFLDSHPEIESAALSTRAQMLASSGDFESATQLLIKSFQLPPLKGPSNSDSLIRPPEHEIPDDPLAASRYYLELGNEVTARRLLGEAARRGGGDPGKLLWLEAELSAREGNWREAFESVLNFLHATCKL